MEQRRESLTELKCRDCANFVLSGWWNTEHVCKVSGLPVDKNGPACIPILPKKAPGKSRESKTK